MIGSRRIIAKFLINQNPVTFFCMGHKIYLTTVPPKNWGVRWCNGEIYLVINFVEKTISFYAEGRLNMWKALVENISSSYYDIEYILRIVVWERRSKGV